MDKGLSGFLRRLRSFVGPHPAVLVGTAVGMVALIAGLAYVFANSQANSRQQAERSFGVQARIRAELASSLFTSSAASASRQAQKQFGTGRPSDRVLTKLVKQSHLAYALI